ncbi:aminopeptidase P family protein [Hippea sp. KM1]|uniref:aminopeptidase P family protein n=1 Tax=Hippea sp. KM1 TaxID=944481 RepID=UPI00046CEFCC|nr:aminopeptidase P family protein [Hippea sp. KM1]
MFEKEVYIKRRSELKRALGRGVAVFFGNHEVAINYPSNTYRFRQDSSFLYYFGIDRPGLVGVIDVDKDNDFVFGDDIDDEDVIWMGDIGTIYDEALKSGLCCIKPLSEMYGYFRDVIKSKREVMFLPQYRFKNMIVIEEVLGIKPQTVNGYASLKLIRAVAEQRLKKSEEEIEQIKKAINISKGMYEIAFDKVREGITESQLLAECEAYAIENGVWLSFPTILTKRGDILHNTRHDGVLNRGDLVVMDSGVETELHYASDITRTIPVGNMSRLQKDIYDIVDSAQRSAIAKAKEGVRFLDVHLESARVIAEGMKGLGFFRGSIDGIVESGAYAVVYLHGVGHPLGLDVHDLEGLGEDYVGYSDSIKRSNKFGLRYLRFAKQLKEGYVMTVEPGIYFISALIEKWHNHQRFSDFVDYDALKGMIGFGGIRLEDDVLIKREGAEVLSKDVRRF